MTKRSPEVIERIREMAAAGTFTKDIATALGVSTMTVTVWAARAGIPVLSQSEAARKANLARSPWSAERQEAFLREAGELAAKYGLSISSLGGTVNIFQRRARGQS